jgi:fatty-acyl-CoA synthase
MRVHDYVTYWAARVPDRVCVDDGTTALTYRQVEAQADRFAHSLRALDVVPGDRVAVLANNCVEWAVIYAGAFKAGAVPVPVNFRLHSHEWTYYAQDSGATIFIAQDRYVVGVESLREELTSVRHFIVLDAGRQRWESFTEVLEKAPDGRFASDTGVDDAMYQIYTSGTTGRPKGAVVTHRAADANLTQLRTVLPLRQGMSHLVAAPVFHTGGAMNMFTGWVAGMTAHLVIDFDPDACAQLIDDAGLHMATLVPAMVQAMLVHSPTVKERSFAALECIQYGASAINQETLRQAIDAFGCDFYQVSGRPKRRRCSPRCPPRTTTALSRAGRSCCGRPGKRSSGPSCASSATTAKTLRRVGSGRSGRADRR